MGKCIIENLTAKYSHKRLDHAKQSATEALKSASRWAIQKTLLIKSLIELQKAQKFHHRTVQKQLKMNQKMEDLITKLLNKNLYLQNKDSKLLIIWDSYKFRTENLVEINGDSCETYNNDSKIKF